MLPKQIEQVYIKLLTSSNRPPQHENSPSRLFFMKPFLPSRLSFCLSPQRQQQLDAMIMANSCSSHASNTSDYPSSQKLINRSPMKVDNELENTEATKEDIVPNEKAQVNIISPTKKLNYGGGHETTGGSGSSGCSLSTMVSVKRSPTVGFPFTMG